MGGASRQVSWPDLSPLPLQRQWLARAGLRLRNWNLAIDGLYRERNSEDVFQRQNLRLSRSLRSNAGHIALSFGLFHSDDSQSGHDKGWQFSASWSPEREHRWSTSTRQAKQSQWTSSYNFRQVEEIGHQAALIHSHKENQNTWIAQAATRQDRWHGRARVESRENAESLQAGLQGAIGWLGGHWFLSRPINGSYAVVQIGDHPDIPVLRHNRIATQTNKRGLAIVPGLRPYQENRIHINPLDIPLSSQLLQSDVIAVPADQRGIFLQMGIQQHQAVELKLMQSPGLAVPAGAVIVGDDIDQRFFVAESGATYLFLTQEDNQFLARWDGGSCHFSLRQDQVPAGFQPHIGNIRCRP